MTYLQLYGDELDRLLGTEDRSQRFTLARRKSAVNAAIRWFNEQIGCFVKRAEVPIVSGTAEYNVEGANAIVAGDYLRPSKTTATLKRYDGSGTDFSDYSYVEGPDLPFKSEEQLNHERPNWRAESASVPDCWTLRVDGPAQYIVLVPAPAVSGAETWTLLWPYVAQPADLTDDAQEPYQVGSAMRTSLRPYHQGIAYYAASLMEEFRKDTEKKMARLKEAGVSVVKYHSDQQMPTGTTMRLANDFRGRQRNRRPLDFYRY